MRFVADRFSLIGAAKHCTTVLSIPATVVLGLVLSSTPALAQSQGRVIRDGTIIWRLETSLPATIAKAGTILDVTARSDRWYEVIIPEAAGGHRERGLIALSQIELVSGSPEPPFRALRGSGASLPPGQRQPAPMPLQDPKEAGATGQPGRRSQPASRRRQVGFKNFMSAGGGYQLTSNVGHDGAALHVNTEDGRFDTNYSVKSGPSFNLAGGGYVWRKLGLGVGVSQFSRSTPTTVNGSIPHPFFFNQPRSVSAEVGGLKRRELAVHVQARGTFPIGSRVQVTGFGGPSFFRLKQDTVMDFTYTDVYPFDQATFGQAQTSTATKSNIGFNGGGDVAFFFTRQLGIGFSATFSRATIEIPSASGGMIPVIAGGTQAGVGLRLRF